MEKLSFLRLESEMQNSNSLITDEKYLRSLDGGKHAPSPNNEHYATTLPFSLVTTTVVNIASLGRHIQTTSAEATNPFVISQELIHNKTMQGMVSITIPSTTILSTTASPYFSVSNIGMLVVNYSGDSVEIPDTTFGPITHQYRQAILDSNSTYYHSGTWHKDGSGTNDLDDVVCTAGEDFYKSGSLSDYDKELIGCAGLIGALALNGEGEIQNLIGLGQAITQMVVDIYNTTSSPNTTVPTTAP